MKVTKAVMTLMILIFCVSFSAFSEEKPPENQMTVKKRLVKVAGDPYHFHRNAEELFLIISGKAMLRTPDGFTEVNKNDVIFFEKGPLDVYQLYNHNDCYRQDKSNLLLAVSFARIGVKSQFRPKNYC